MSTYWGEKYAAGLKDQVVSLKVTKHWHDQISDSVFTIVSALEKKARSYGLVAFAFESPWNFEGLEERLNLEFRYGVDNCIYCHPPEDAELRAKLKNEPWVRFCR